MVLNYKPTSGFYRSNGSDQSLLIGSRTSSPLPLLLHFEESIVFCAPSFPSPKLLSLFVCDTKFNSVTVYNILHLFSVYYKLLNVLEYSMDCRQNFLLAVTLLHLYNCTHRHLFIIWWNPQSAHILSNSRKHPNAY
jgi:hypothetical protein